MRVLALCAIGVAGLLASSATVANRDGWKDLRGEPVPEIRVTEWLNTDGSAPSVADLKGKVWLLEFFATW